MARTSAVPGNTKVAQRHTHTPQPSFAPLTRAPTPTPPPPRPSLHLARSLAGSLVADAVGPLGGRPWPPRGPHSSHQGASRKLSAPVRRQDQASSWWPASSSTWQQDGLGVKRGRRGRGESGLTCKGEEGVTGKGIICGQERVKRAGGPCGWWAHAACRTKGLGRGCRRSAGTRQAAATQAARGECKRATASAG
jgi:hypothetical protein